MFGAGFLARWLGWSPVGRRIELSLDDAPSKDLYGRHLRGTLIALDDSGAALIELDEPPPFGIRGTRRLRAVPRHVGYDFHHLRFGFIAASLSLANSPGGAADGPTFAIASVRLAKEH